jgi:hypothetical protein
MGHLPRGGGLDLVARLERAETELAGRKDRKAKA